LYSSAPLFLVCDDVTDENGSMRVGTIPVMLENPSKQCSFTLLTQNLDGDDDTISCTYVVTFLDRKMSVVYYQRGVIDRSVSGSDCYDNNRITLEWADERIPHGNGFISRQTLTASQKIMRTDIFAYSTKRNETFGAGSVWVQ
jgi:hypothetical protein